MSSPQEVPQKKAAPGADGGENAQTFWMDQQGNVYYATGFPGATPASPSAAPMGIPNAHSSHQHYAPPVSYQGGGQYPQQGWQQQGMPNMYNEGYYYQPGGYEQQPYFDPSTPRYHNYGPPELNHGAAHGTPPHGSPHGSPVQSPVNSPGRYGEMMRALQQNDPAWPMEYSAGPMGAMQPIEWADMKGRVVTLCKTRTGSVAIQSQLEECSPEVLDEILGEMIGSLAGLISDRYGSHVTRQLVDRCNAAQRLRIWDDIKNRLVKVACTRYGTWTVQALLDSIENEEQLAALKEALPPENVIKLMKDQHGGHTIARCAQKLPGQDCLFVFEAAATSLAELCKHKYGCTTLQRMLESADEAASIMMAQEVSKIGETLTKDQYGNYILQHVLGLEFPSCFEPRGILFDSLRGSFLKLSMHKYGSNIVEKCLKMGETERSAVVLELVTEDGSLEQLISHPYGNYVAQSALMLCSEEELKLFQQRLESFADESDKKVAGLLKDGGNPGDAILSAIGDAPQGGGGGGRGRNGGGSMGMAANGGLEPFRKTVHGRKILQKLHMRTNSSNKSSESGSDETGSDGGTITSDASNPDESGSRHGAAGVTQQQHAAGNKAGGGRSRGRSRGGARGGDRRGGNAMGMGMGKQAPVATSNWQPAHLAASEQ